MDPNNNKSPESSSHITPQPVSHPPTPTLTQVSTENPTPQPNPMSIQPQVATASAQTPYVSRKKLVAYFLIGLITSFLGVIVAGLWIAIKVKENKKPRILSLLGGFGGAIILAIVFNLIIKPLLVKSYPEFAYIPSALATDYPDAKFNIGFNTTKNLSGQSAGETTSILTVSVITKQNLTGVDRKDIGVKVCDLLKEHGTNYSNVEVAQTKVSKILIFSFDQSLTEGRTCQEWLVNPPREFTNINQ